MSNLAVKTQGPQPISDLTNLNDRVKKLTHPVHVLANGYLRLQGENTESLLSALLSEIDETILPRRIRLVTNTDQVLHLYVTDRRLMRLARPKEQQTSQAARPSKLIDQLRELLAGATKAAIQSTRANVARSHSNPGYTASELAGVATLELTPPETSDPVPALFTTLASRMVASVTFDPAGNISGRGGNPDWLRQLENLARKSLADIDAQMIQSLSDPDQPGCLLLSAGDDDGFMLLYARSHASGFMAILPTSELPAIQPAWRAFYS